MGDADRRQRAAAKDPKLVAAIDLLGRTGAADVQIRYCDDEDPTVWFVVVRYRTDPTGRPVHGDSEPGRWETAAGRHPTEAALRLCERVVDGGRCNYCKRPAMFHAELDQHPTLYGPLFCSFEWDPELTTFRRACEGDT